MPAPDTPAGSGSAPGLDALGEARVERSPAGSMVWLISLAVLLASSTWFSGTAASDRVIAAWGLSAGQAVWLTISVQLGFISGTFLYAALNLADIYSPCRVFLVSALLGAAFNGLFASLAQDLWLAVPLRFATGVTLAGIYPVGMKLVASWFRSGLGWRLGVMVGALTMGTALPYLLQALGTAYPWRHVVGAGSVLAVCGGLLVGYVVREGPFLPQRVPFDARMMFKVFRKPEFRYTAFGYFGHMWELYALWSLLSFWLEAATASADRALPLARPLAVFAVIACGTLGCVAGGWISQRAGERRVALVSLVISGCMGALSGWAFALPSGLLLGFALVWGIFVVSDSPQFSALAARHAPAQYVGTALTVQNGIGFAVTALSIQLLPLLAPALGWRWIFALLVPGPVLGTLAMLRLGKLTAGRAD